MGDKNRHEALLSIVSLLRRIQTKRLGAVVLIPEPCRLKIRVVALPEDSTKEVFSPDSLEAAQWWCFKYISAARMEFVPR